MANRIDAFIAYAEDSGLLDEEQVTLSFDTEHTEAKVHMSFRKFKEGYNENKIY